MKLNRKWVLAIALLLSVAVATAGTLAYLTDRDTVENTFTMGNVDIEVEEDFPEEGAPIEPGQEVNKDAKITNQGKNPAWVWMTVSVPEELKDHVTLKWANGFEPTSDSPAIVDGQAVWTVLVDEQLPAGESTKYILDSVTLSEYVDYQGGQYVVVKDGNATTLESLEGGKFDVTVTGYATQVDGVDTVEDAYKAYNRQWGSNDAEATVVSTMEDLIAALEDAENNPVISVASGEYDFSDSGLVITKPVTIRAEDENNKPVFLMGTSDATGGSNSIFHGIEIKSDNVTLQNLNLQIKEGTISSGNLVQISANGTDFYSDITIDGCEFYGSDHCIALYGNNVTIKNCKLDESSAKSQGNIIYVWGTSGDLVIQNNQFIGKDQRKHAISLYYQPPYYHPTASRISDNILIDGNTFSDVYKGVVHESNMTYSNVSMTISNNTFTNYKKKPVAIDNGTFVSYTVTGNVFNMPSEGTCVIDNVANAAITADANYWGYESPDWNSVIEGSNVTVNTYYTDSAKTNLVSK